VARAKKEQKRRKLEKERKRKTPEARRERTLDDGNDDGRGRRERSAKAVSTVARFDAQRCQQDEDHHCFITSADSTAERPYAI